MSGEPEIYSKQNYIAETWLKEKYLDCFPLKRFRYILEVDQRAKKLMTMHKALDFRDDVGRLYVSRKEGRRGLPALKTALTHQYNYLKNIQKSAEKD